MVQQQPFQILNDKIYNVSLGMTVKQHYTDAQKCRLELEKWLNPMIDEFLSMGEDMPPLIDLVWDMDTRFIVNMKLHSLSKNGTVMLFSKQHGTGKINSVTISLSTVLLEKKK